MLSKPLSKIKDKMKKKQIEMDMKIRKLIHIVQHLTNRSSRNKIRKNRE